MPLKRVCSKLPEKQKISEIGQFKLKLWAFENEELQYMKLSRESDEVL